MFAFKRSIHCKNNCLIDYFMIKYKNQAKIFTKFALDIVGLRHVNKYAI